MSSKRNNNYKIAILLLSFFLLIVLFKSYKDNKSAKELQDTLKQETLITQNQLSEILTKYDSVSNLYNNFEESFQDLSLKVTDLKDPKKNVKFKNLTELNI
jgi:predicted signal transduction protein with EAL and GGDEF domain